jgi:hypothetical protein
LCEVVPALKNVAHVVRASTSSGIKNTVTGETFAGSGGFHIYVPVLDASDISRFLSDLHDRLWLAGFGWGIVSAAGSFLERALIDKSVGSPERLAFEGPAILDPPLEQARRDAVVHDGGILDTKRACLPLTDSERDEVLKLKAAEEARLLPERTAARAKWIESHVEKQVKRGIPEAEARAQATHWADSRDLTGDFPLPFDDPAIAGTTVAQVLATPEKYIGKRLSDPHEGPKYGRGKAILYRRYDGTLWIKSYAHGGINYELKTTEAAERDAEIERLARTHVRCANGGASIAPCRRAGRRRRGRDRKSHGAHRRHDPRASHCRMAQRVRYRPKCGNRHARSQRHPERPRNRIARRRRAR